MPSLETYSKELDYSYALGIFPCMEAMKKAPETVRRLLISQKGEDSEGVRTLVQLAADKSIRVETADKVLGKISGKDNCFAAAVFSKRELKPDSDKPHIVLHNPSDKGNIGTILRTALGFGLTSVAVIAPCADVFDPHTVRASMGALFSLNVSVYSSFADYRKDYAEHKLFPFMLTGSCPIEEAVRQKGDRYALVFGNEGAGLPEAFASYGVPTRIPHSDSIDSLNLSIAFAIGAYEFTKRGV
ncbi:MAG: TrmH family RNA methyltransferase [Eubacteriales bacterium]|nr:TrmH family RNA methyltransferase [Eubacteriales bacterium]MDD3882173.1 TrmH family RNA methyltransferase [Eubacteriales bacterium]MDD4513783.1 TrmH family RNA methyltransferase [Eubacteriales bacterium]